MLNTKIHSRPAGARQQGIVLIVVIVVLVAMTLAAIALTRSVLTSNRVAGNLALQQVATQAADIGIEQAIAWLENNNGATLEHSIKAAPGVTAYRAFRQDPTGTDSWEAYWNNILSKSDYVNQVSTGATPGHVVSYVIERMCAAEGPATTGVGCSESPTTVGNKGSSRGAGGISFDVADQLYYRITVRVEGARNAVSFVQAVVAL